MYVWVYFTSALGCRCEAAIFRSAPIAHSKCSLQRNSWLMLLRNFQGLNKHALAPVKCIAVESNYIMDRASDVMLVC